MKSFGSWLRVKKAKQAEWDAMPDYVLKTGEFGIVEPDTPSGTAIQYVKMGDNITKWPDLPWFGAAPAASPGP